MKRLTQKNPTILIGMVLCIIVSACSSPESDGIKAAKMAEKMAVDYQKKRNEIIREQNKAYESYLKKFDSYSFKTRVDAREKLNEYLEKSRESLQKHEANGYELGNIINEYRDKLKSKYVTNREKEEKFYYAFNNYQPTKLNSIATESVNNDYQSQINAKIQAIIPPKPDLERLKNDLIGRTINNLTTGYTNWKLNSLDELNELEIRNSTDSGAEYLFDINLILQGAANKWEANVSAKYVLGNYDDWRINTVEGNMNIVGTGKYNDCISTQFIQYRGLGIPDRPVEFTNSCDVSLVVEGVATFSGITNRSTREFNIQVPANGKTRLPGYVVEFNIHFVEQAGL